MVHGLASGDHDRMVWLWELLAPVQPTSLVRVPSGRSGRRCAGLPLKLVVGGHERMAYRSGFLEGREVCALSEVV